MKRSIPTIALVTAIGMLGGCMPMSVASESVAPELLAGVLARRSGPEATATAPTSTGPTTTGSPSATPGGSTPDATAGAPATGQPDAASSELDGSASASASPPPPTVNITPVEDSIPEGSTYDNDPKEDRRQRVRKGVFWTGIVLAAVGVGGTIGFGVGGRVMQEKLDDGYADESLTHDQEDRYRNTGDVMNVLAATSAGVALVGAVMSAVAYGIDYTACGTLAYRKRKDCQPKQRNR